MSPAVLRVLGPVLAVVALGASGVVLLPRLLRWAAGPETEIVTLLKKSEQTGFEIPIPGTSAPLASSGHRFDRISTQVDLQARTAVVTATLDFTGKLGETQVSSLGYERIRFSYTGSTWVPMAGLAPRLAAVVAALERRRAALESGDAGFPPELADLAAVTNRRYRARAWFIRSERGAVEVREEFRLVGDLPDRPVDTLGATRLSLSDADGGFFFSGGIR